MAAKRMFNLSVVNTDKFFDLPPRAQVLYFHMGMRADDDGILENPRTVSRTCGASSTDIEALIAGGYIIPFPSGVVAITHWHLHNAVQKDRYKTSLFVNELRQLRIVDDVYQLADAGRAGDPDRSGDARTTERALQECSTDTAGRQRDPKPGTSCSESVPGSESVCNDTVTEMDTEWIQNVSRTETERNQSVSGVETQKRIDENSIDNNRPVQHSTAKIRSDYHSTAEGRKDARAPTREVIHNAGDNSAEEELRAKLEPEAMAKVMAFCRDTQKARGGMNG